MIDPFLLAHQVLPRCFEIGGILSPVSIRDQMVRGCWIVDRVIESRLVLRHQQLLVIGAGVAGATAAIEAARRGISVVLIDKASQPFLRQATCTSRWVDPTQYDWPVDHWDRQQFPWMSPPPVVPLQWKAARANTLALVWTAQLYQAMQSFPVRLSFSPNTGIKTLGIVVSALPNDPARTELEVELQGGKLAGTQRFSVAVSTVGFGTEDTTVGRFSSWRFWDTDPLEQHDFGLGRGASPDILISGGGDGALQDLLRTLTIVKSAREVYDAISLPAPRRAELEHRLQSAEDQAQRSYIWSKPPEGSVARDHHIHHQLHQAYLDEVDELEKNHWTALEPALNAVARPAGSGRVSMVFRCSHFDRCYGLNRFVALLLARFYAKSRGLTVLYPNTALEKIDSAQAAHACANDADVCYGKKHRADFKVFRCPGVQGAHYSSHPRSDYDIVCLRHGIQRPDSVFGSTARAIPFPRQMMPYSSPW